MSNVAKIEQTPQEIAAVPEQGTTMLAVIARAAADPQCDVDKMERLMAMHERMQASQRQAEFSAALSAMQSELPSIMERGKIKDRSGGVQSKYALWEDVNDAIKPVMQRHGFALTFRTDFTNGITVTGVLSHRCGHREETSITLPSDTSGSKNNVQAIGSSVSYGKRYTAGALLNLTSHGEDDDGKLGGSKLGPRDMEWIEGAAAITDPEQYTSERALLIAFYKSEHKIPADVRRAFAAAKSRVMPKD